VNKVEYIYLCVFYSQMTLKFVSSIQDGKLSPKPTSTAAYVVILLNKLTLMCSVRSVIYLASNRDGDNRLSCCNYVL